MAGFEPLKETNCLFLSHSLFRELGGCVEGFDMPGGGFLNFDIYKRAVEHPGTNLVTVLGEATFHQIHGGTTTNISPDKLKQLRQIYQRQYSAIFGKEYTAPVVPTCYIGHMPPQAVLSLKTHKDNEYNKLIDEIEAKENEINDLSRICSERATLINQLAKTCSEREAVIHELSAVCREREMLINKLSQAGINRGGDYNIRSNTDE